MSEFHTSGAVPLDSLAYVSRSFENCVFNEIVSGQWVLLLGPRQHGKTSGILRVIQRLREVKLRTAWVDLQSLPPCQDYSQLLRSISAKIAKSLGTDVGTGLAEEDDFLSWLSVVCPTDPTPIVLFIDEAANIENDQHRNSFYGQIRQISSIRAIASPTDVARKVRFVFSGTFRPETLVSGMNSPFNVCQTIYTEDLSVDQVLALARRVGPTMEPFVETAFEAVGGQPFLLQTLFKGATRDSTIPATEAFANVIRDLPQLVASHLEGIFSKIIGSPSLAQKVSSMLEHGYATLEPADSDCRFLQVLGVANRTGAKLVFRNRLYEETATSTTQLGAGVPVPGSGDMVFGLDRTSFAFMRSTELREIASSAYGGAVICHRSSRYRLALAGYGCATEAMLLDWLLSMKSADLSVAVNAATSEKDSTKRAQFAQKELSADPRTWRLVNLINVARKVHVGTNAPEPSHRAREWRNQIHPAVALTDYMNEPLLQPESMAAAALFAMLFRDLARLAANP